MPTDHDSFLRIKGVGNNKVRQFGERFLEVITEHVAQSPAPRVGTVPPDPAAWPGD